MVILAEQKTLLFLYFLQVVKGLDLSLFDMCVGERRKIEIPARLAYGRKGSKAFGVPPDDGTVRETTKTPCCA